MRCALATPRCAVSAAAYRCVAAPLRPCSRVAPPRLAAGLWRGGFPHRLSASQAGPAPTGGAVSAGEPPKLEKRWTRMGLAEQRAHLEALRDYYGEGTIVEESRATQWVVALLDTPVAERLWQPGIWYQDFERKILCSTGYLHRLAAAHALRLVSWGHWKGMEVHFADGCSGNCLARNLIVTPRSVKGSVAPEWAKVLSSRAAQEGEELSPILRTAVDIFLPAYAQEKVERVEEAQAKAAARAVREEATRQRAQRMEVEARERVMSRVAAAAKAVWQKYGKEDALRALDEARAGMPVWEEELERKERQWEQMRAASAAKLEE